MLKTYVGLWRIAMGPWAAFRVVGTAIAMLKTYVGLWRIAIPTTPPN